MAICDRVEPRVISVEGRLTIFPLLIQQLVSEYEVTTSSVKTRSLLKVDEVIMKTWQDLILYGEVRNNYPDIAIYLPEEKTWKTMRVTEPITLDSGKWGKFTYNPEALVINKFDSDKIREMKLKLNVSFVNQYSSAKLKIGRRI